MELTSNEIIETDGEIVAPNHTADAVQSTALAVTQPRYAVRQMTPQEIAMPVLQVAEAVARYEQFRQIVQSLMHDGEDFGLVPGIKKKFLWKAGAEKLATFYGLEISMSLQNSEREIKGDFPWFYYRYKATARKGGQLVAECEGSCNSFESKYRYQWLDDDPPDKQTELAMLELKEGRWRRFNNKTVWQRRIFNPDPFSLLNTVEKMAQKRGYVGAVILAVNGSGFFGSYEENQDDGKPRTGERQQAAKAKAVKLGADATDFWSAQRISGIQQADAAPIAAQAQAGTITWEKAISQLPK